MTQKKMLLASSSPATPAISAERLNLELTFDSFSEVTLARYQPYFQPTGEDNSNTKRIFERSTNTKVDIIHISLTLTVPNLLPPNASILF